VKLKINIVHYFFVQQVT